MSDLSSVRLRQPNYTEQTSNAKQEVGQLYFIIHNNMNHIFLKTRAHSHSKSYKSRDHGVPIQSLYICINRAVRPLTQTVLKLGLPVFIREK